MTTDRSLASATTYLRRIADALERMAPASTPIPDIETDGVRIRGCTIEHDPPRVDPGVRVEVEVASDIRYEYVYWVKICAPDGRYWRLENASLARVAAEESAALLRTALGLDRPPAPELDIEARIAEAVREEREAVVGWLLCHTNGWSVVQRRAEEIERGEHRAQERKGPQG